MLDVSLSRALKLTKSNTLSNIDWNIARELSINAIILKREGKMVVICMYGEWKVGLKIGEVLTQILCFF